MEHTIEEGVFGRGDVYRFYDVEEARQHEPELESWQHFVNKFEEIIGKSYKPNKYKVVGLEDNESMADYYFILEDNQGNRLYKLANNTEFYKQFE